MASTSPAGKGEAKVSISRTFLHVSEVAWSFEVTEATRATSCPPRRSWREDEVDDSNDYVQALLEGAFALHEASWKGSVWEPATGTNSSATSDASGSPPSSAEPGSPRDDEDEEGPPEEIIGAAVMLCNIPCKVEDSDLLAMLRHLGFHNKTKGIHLPKRKKSNLGYAFVKFHSVSDAAHFAKTAHGYMFPQSTSFKRLEVRNAHKQQSSMYREKA